MSAQVSAQRITISEPAGNNKNGPERVSISEPSGNKNGPERVTISEPTGHKNRSGPTQDHFPNLSRASLKSFERTEWDNKAYIRNNHKDHRNTVVDIECPYCCDCAPTTSSNNVGAMIYEGRNCTCDDGYHKNYQHYNSRRQPPYILWTPIPEAEYERRFPPRPAKMLTPMSTPLVTSPHPVTPLDVQTLQETDVQPSETPTQRQFKGKVFDHKTGKLMSFDIKVDKTGQYHGTRNDKDADSIQQSDRVTPEHDGNRVTSQASRNNSISQQGENRVTSQSSRNNSISQQTDHRAESEQKQTT